MSSLTNSVLVPREDKGLPPLYPYKSKTLFLKIFVSKVCIYVSLII